MKQEEWRELSQKIAVEMFVNDATEMMIAEQEARVLAEKLLHDSQRQDAYLVQRFRTLTHYAGDALIAIEKLGFAVVVSGGSSTP